ncbi:hypothetical protein BGZ65_001730, partial [Modicella reniformis]
MFMIKRPQNTSSQSNVRQYGGLYPRRFVETTTTTFDERCCRICFETEEDDKKNFGSAAAGNKLISPCGCKGTFRYVHQVCLKRWQQECLNDSDRCEICRCQYSISKGWIPKILESPWIQPIVVFWAPLYNIVWVRHAVNVVMWEWER